MFCVICGSKNPDFGKFCSTCGQSLYRSEPERPSEARPSSDPVVLNGTSAPHTTAVAQPSTSPQENQTPPTSQAHAVEISTDEGSSAGGEASQASAATELSTALQSSKEDASYPTLSTRFAAYATDLAVLYFAFVWFGVLIGALGAFFPGATKLLDDSFGLKIVSFLVFALYMTLSQTLYHSSIGKYLFRLELRSTDENEVYPPFGRILLREVIGRPVASFFFGIGYWGINRRYKHQAWSDQLAHTYVAWRPINAALRRVLAISVVVGIVSMGGVIAFGLVQKERQEKRSALEKNLVSATSGIGAAQNRVNSLLGGPAAESMNELRNVWRQVDEALVEMDRSVGQTRVAIASLEATGALSKKESEELALIKEMVRVKQEMIEKYRQESAVVRNYDEVNGDGKEFMREITALDSDLEASNAHYLELARRLSGKPAK